MIDRSTIDRIFAAADIVEVVSDYVTLKRKGVNYTACCPFHSEKTPSFMVSPAKGLFKCFGCGKGGNAVTFVMEHEKLSYPEALKLLAKKYSILIEEEEQSDQQRQANDDRESMMVLNSWAETYFKEQLKQDSVAHSYFVERGFTDETIEKFGLGYCPDKGDAMATAALKEGYKEEFLEKTGLAGKRERGGYYDRFYGRVMFPIHSLSGRVIGFGGRTLRTDKKVAKYLNSPESEVYHKSYTLYGIHHAKRAMTQSDRCILVEGYTDVIQMHQAGIENVVASSGTSLTEEQIRLIKRFTQNVTVIYDGDSAGIKASMRGIDMILKEGLTVRCVMLPDGEDPDSFARGNNHSYLQEYLSRNEIDFITFKTNLLLGDAKEDPIKRADLITDIIGSIAIIPNAIERQVYIRECSRLMDVPENVLQIEVQRKLIGSVDGRQWYENIRRKERFEQRQQGASVRFDGAQTGRNDDYPQDFPPDVPPDDLLEGYGEKKSDTLTEIEVLERELIGYLVKYGHETFKLDPSFGETDETALSVSQTIVDEVRELQMHFHTPLYAQIFDLYANAAEGETPVPDTLINSHDPEISSFVTDLHFGDQRYTESRLWEKSERVATTEKDRLSEAIPKALSLMFQKIVNHNIAEQMQLLSQCGEVDIEIETRPETADELQGFNGSEALETENQANDLGDVSKANDVERNEKTETIEKRRLLTSMEKVTVKEEQVMTDIMTEIARLNEFRKHICEKFERTR